MNYPTLVLIRAHEVALIIDPVDLTSVPTAPGKAMVETTPAGKVDCGVGEIVRQS